jgi:transposase
MAKTIFATENEVNRYKNLTETLQLQDLVVVGQEFHEINNSWIFVCIPRWFVSVCPDCGQVCRKIHDYPHQRTIHDSPIHGRQTLLIFDVYRFWCDGCQSPFTQPIGDVVPECTYTYHLMREIAHPRRKQDVATLAEIYGLGYKLVESIILKAADSQVKARGQAPLKVKKLGVDELSNHKGRGDYVLVLTDLERRVLLDILPNRQKQTLIDWLKNPPKGVDLSLLETVATDMWSHYREAVKEVYPQTRVVADRFHVVQNLNEVIHTCRRQAQQHAHTEEERRQLKGLRYILIKNKSKLNESEVARLEALALSHPQLYALVKLRQQLHEWYETETTPELAQLSLNLWITQAKAIGFHALNQFCLTLTHWQTEIVNFFAERVTSGFVEGMNSKIRLLKRLAFGLPNFQHFRLRMLWACG